MIAFMQVLEDIAKAVLLPAMNVAVGATIIAALAVIISRLWFLSLPLRHAICVCGVAGAIVAPPLIISLESLASRFTEIGTTEWPVRKRTNSELVAAPQQLTQDTNLPSASLNHQPATETHAIEVTSSPDVLNDSVTAEAEHPKDTASLSTVKSPLYISNGRVDYGLMLGKLFVFVWIIGSIFFLLRHVFAELRLRRWIQTCDPIADVETLHAAQSAAMIVGLNDHSPLRRLAVQFRLRRWSTRRGRIAEATALEAVQCAATAVGVEQRPVLLRSNTLPAPVVCGVLKPKLILPETMATGADGLSHDQLAAVLTHEMAHLARRDLVTGLSLTAAKMIYWWNPLILWLCSHAEDLGEQICDDFATTSISQPREYVSALLHFAEQSTHHSTHSSSLGLAKSTMSQLEFRVQRILYSTQSKSLRVGIKNCFVLVFMTTIISATASMMQICAAEGNEPTAEDEVVQMPETLNALERQEPKNEVTKHKSVEELSDAIDTDSEWGSVYGRVQVTNPNRIDLRPKLLLNAGGPANIQANVFSDDLLVDPQSGGLEGAFVYLAKAPSVIHPDAARIPITPLIFDQVRGRFAPHLMIVRVGQSVECVNTSTIAVNVHIYPLRNQAVNLTLRPVTKPGSGHLWMPKKGESLPMRVASDFHPWMQGYWLALDHPYAAITDKQGRFVIENLPPGEHIVKIWHERVGYIERKLNVAIERGKITAQPTFTVEASTLMPQ